MGEGDTVGVGGTRLGVIGIIVSVTNTISGALVDPPWQAVIPMEITNKTTIRTFLLNIRVNIK
jgi:hypothetical protein